MPNEKNDYGIKVKPITTRNPQANAIVERVHQRIGSMIRTFELYDNDGIDDDDPWSGILAAIMAAVRSTYSTTTQATPMQLVFGRDAIIKLNLLLIGIRFVSANKISYIIITSEKTRSKFRTHIKLAIELC